MRIFRSLEEARTSFAPSAVTIGNFDGVHVAHHELMRAVVRMARECGAKPSALTFSPHPTEVVAPERAPLLLSSPAERCALMARDGVEQALILPFDAHLSSLDPEAFFREVLLDALGARAVVVGDNFLFGSRQSGNVGTLRGLGEKYGVQVVIVQAVKWRGILVSSSAIRGRLATGDVGSAARLLGRPFAVSGLVVAGEGRGRRETVPTLNLEMPPLILDRAAVPANGVYVTRTFELGEEGDVALKAGAEVDGADGDSPLCPQRDRGDSPLAQADSSRARGGEVDGADGDSPLCPQRDRGDSPLAQAGSSRARGGEGDGADGDSPLCPQRDRGDSPLAQADSSRARGGEGDGVEGDSPLCPQRDRGDSPLAQAGSSRARGGEGGGADGDSPLCPQRDRGDSPLAQAGSSRARGGEGDGAEGDGAEGDSPLCPQRDRGDSPRGRGDSPRGQVDSPLARVDSPLAQAGSPRGQADSSRGRCWHSVTNVGYRPTFGGRHLTIETFLLDALEGNSPARIRVEFLRRLRDERTFPNANALREQIMHDVKRAQAYFRRIGAIWGSRTPRPVHKGTE